MSVSFIAELSPVYCCLVSCIVRYCWIFTGVPKTSRFSITGSFPVLIIRLRLTSDERSNSDQPERSNSDETSLRPNTDETTKRSNSDQPERSNTDETSRRSNSDQLERSNTAPYCTPIFDPLARIGKMKHKSVQDLPSTILQQNVLFFEEDL